MTIKWSYSYNSFCKIVPLSHCSLLTLFIPIDPKHSLIEGLHCTYLCIHMKHMPKVPKSKNW